MLKDFKFWSFGFVELGKRAYTRLARTFIMFCVLKDWLNKRLVISVFSICANYNLGRSIFQLLEIRLTIKSFPSLS